MQRMAQSGMAVSSLLVAVVATALTVPAQTHDDGALWLGYFAQGRLGTDDSGRADLRWWLDAQVRQRDDGEHFDLGIVRPGLGWALTERVSLWAGYAFVPTDPLGRDEFVEHRTWQALHWAAPVTGFSLTSRTRLEQRFVETDGDTGWRLRQMLKVTVPFGADSRLFASVWDEAFFDLDDTDWGQRQGFRQNRAFAGLGWFLDTSRQISLEVGYLNQWLDRRGEDRLNHALSLSLFMTF